MIKAIRFLLWITLFVGFTGGIISAIETDQAIKEIVKGREVPEFELKVIDNAEPLTKGKLIGKVYLLAFDDAARSVWRKCRFCMIYLRNIRIKTL